MTPAEAHHNSHSSPSLGLASLTHVGPGNCWQQQESACLRQSAERLFRIGTRYARGGSATNCALSLRVALKSVRRSFVASALGVASCVHHRGRSARQLPKSTDRMGRRPTNWSKTFFPTSLSHCGARTLRPSSPARSDAACAPASATWKARASGPARPSPPSSKKFSIVTACATCA